MTTGHFGRDSDPAAYDEPTDTPTSAETDPWDEILHEADQETPTSEPEPEPEPEPEVEPEVEVNPWDAIVAPGVNDPVPVGPEGPVLPEAESALATPTAPESIRTLVALESELERTRAERDQMRATLDDLRTRFPDVAAYLDTPAPEHPAPEQPEADTPEAEQPEAEQPEADTSEAEQPEAEQPEADTPEAEQPEAEQPEAEQPEAEQPEAEQPEVEQPEVEQPEAEQPEADTPDAGYTVDDWERTIIAPPVNVEPAIDEPEVDQGAGGIPQPAAASPMPPASRLTPDGATAPKPDTSSLLSTIMSAYEQYRAAQNQTQQVQHDVPTGPAPGSEIVTTHPEQQQLLADNPKPRRSFAERLGRLGGAIREAWPGARAALGRFGQAVREGYLDKRDEIFQQRHDRDIITKHPRDITPTDVQRRGDTPTTDHDTTTDHTIDTTDTRPDDPTADRDHDTPEQDTPEQDTPTDPDRDQDTPGLDAPEPDTPTSPDQKPTNPFVAPGPHQAETPAPEPTPAPDPAPAPNDIYNDNPYLATYLRRTMGIDDPTAPAPAPGTWGPPPPSAVDDHLPRTPASEEPIRSR